jgi:hypothetical protein
MSDRTVDLDHDGVRDAFFVFSHGILAEERHDKDNDGRIDVITSYADRKRVETREDRDGDGDFDTRTLYHVVDGEELVSRIESDTRKRGLPDIIETFEAKDGRAVLARKEEDTDCDGTVDTTSFYEDGKLARREIFDPSALQR